MSLFCRFSLYTKRKSGGKRETCLMEKGSWKPHDPFLVLFFFAHLFLLTEKKKVRG